MEPSLELGRGFRYLQDCVKAYHVGPEHVVCGQDLLIVLQDEAMNILSCEVEIR